MDTISRLTYIVFGGGSQHDRHNVAQRLTREWDPAVEAAEKRTRDALAERYAKTRAEVIAKARAELARAT